MGIATKASNFHLSEALIIAITTAEYNHHRISCAYMLKREATNCSFTRQRAKRKEKRIHQRQRIVVRA